MAIRKSVGGSWLSRKWSLRNQANIFGQKILIISSIFFNRPRLLKQPILQLGSGKTGYWPLASIDQTIASLIRSFNFLRRSRVSSLQIQLLMFGRSSRYTLSPKSEGRGFQRSPHHLDDIRLGETSLFLNFLKSDPILPRKVDNSICLLER